MNQGKPSSSEHGEVLEQKATQVKILILKGQVTLK